MFITMFQKKNRNLCYISCNRSLCCEKYGRCGEICGELDGYGDRTVFRIRMYVAFVM
ncbi:hypothetical protein Igag_0824 [Ignisphaera aggregans DSM 17230]|uniref:Uncharacterized protein n=1 Tax=Ignisphaera aggregans (strain DSM 17230 / JCM 13409 / AQ1.S1) TaxID=583356 RepID=E0STN1_IGNAA|nr:hypothetical protein Igag_0824 [Ignisphaera aggregans DSM 17230]